MEVYFITINYVVAETCRKSFFFHLKLIKPSTIQLCLISDNSWKKDGDGWIGIRDHAGSRGRPEEDQEPEGVEADDGGSRESGVSGHHQEVGVGEHN